MEYNITVVTVRRWTCNVDIVWYYA